jgi:putative transposase
MKYRRAWQAGGTYFFTVNLAERSRTLLVDHIENLRSTVRKVKQAHPFDIFAWVVLPDHLHAIWTLPENDSDFATRWMLIKAGFSRSIPKGEWIRPARQRKGERGLWQRRFWEHLIVDEDDLQRHVDYVHINPVKHGYAARASEWPYSSYIATSAVAGCRRIGRQRREMIFPTESVDGVGVGVRRLTPTYAFCIPVPETPPRLICHWTRLGFAWISEMWQHGYIR